MRRREVYISCLLCGGPPPEQALEIKNMPVLSNRLWNTERLAKTAPVGTVSLAVCGTCGALYNSSFDPSLVTYDPAYENSLHHSPTFSAFASELAERLISSHDLAGRTVLDIGSGKGDFLAMLCDAGAGRGIGFDPSHPDQARDTQQDPRLTFHPHVYTGGPEAQQADLVTCRHVLEHLERPQELLRTLRGGIKDTATVYLEVPNGRYMVEQMALWDLIYEHAWYFTAPAMQTLVSSCRFETTLRGECFGRQYLYWEAEPAGAAEGGPEASEVQAICDLAHSFGRRYQELIAQWERRVEAYAERSLRIALWGVGSKGVSFLNLVSGTETIESIVDLNPRKHNRHVPGTGQRVIGPVELSDRGADVVLVMNRLYAREIAEAVHTHSPQAQIVVVD